MTRHPYGPDELDRHDPDLDAIAERLERYAGDVPDEVPIGLAARIHAAIDDEPMPAAGWWASLIGGRLSGSARAFAVAGVVALAIVGAFAIGEVAQALRQPNVGTSPSPSTVSSPSQSPSATPEPTATSSPSPTVPTPTLSPSPLPISTAQPTIPLPTATDDHGGDRSPRPSGSDHSGPGGGGSGSGG